MYGNLTYFYNPLTWKADAYLFNLKDEIGENIKTAGDNVPIPQGDISKFAFKSFGKDRRHRNVGSRINKS